MSADEEVRITSETGGQKGAKAARLGGTDPLAMMELARVYGFGESKYERYNYLKGYDWSLSVDALLRHLFAFLSGEDRDPESGLLHTAHVAWHGLTLSSFLIRHAGTDDRPPRLEQETEMRRVNDIVRRVQSSGPDALTVNEAMLELGIDPAEAAEAAARWAEQWAAERSEPTTINPS